METTFTPMASFLGGALIGLAAAMLLLFNGAIAGISGILGNALFTKSNDRPWRLFFLAGLPIGAVLGVWATADTMGFTMTTNTTMLLLGGGIVGIGSQLGHGCTSGHGVCGIARGSRRSVLATVIFMLSAIVTVYITRHVIGVTS